MTPRVNEVWTVRLDIVELEVFVFAVAADGTLFHVVFFAFRARAMVLQRAPFVRKEGDFSMRSFKRWNRLMPKGQALFLPATLNHPDLGVYGDSC